MHLFEVAARSGHIVTRAVNPIVGKFFSSETCHCVDIVFLRNRCVVIDGVGPVPVNILTHAAAYMVVYFLLLLVDKRIWE